MRAVVVVMIVAVGCGNGQAPGTGSGSSAKPAAHGPQVMDEPLTTRTIADPQQKLTVGVVAVPKTWNYESHVEWNYANISYPLTVSSAATNPANAEAVFGYPAVQLFWFKGSPNYFKPGTRSGGLIYLKPMTPSDALVEFIKTTRGNMTNLKFVGQKELPELPAALKMPASPNQHGIGVKVTYEQDGKPIEEEFYAVQYVIDIPYDGPQGRTWQTNWGLLAPHSFRAPAGTLDARRPVFAAVAKSFRANPEWTARVKAVNAYLLEQFNRQLQAGYDQIAAAGRLSRQISANNDAMIASMDHQRAAAARTNPTAAAEGRSENDKFDDYIRGVDTVDDPYYGTSQHSSNEQYHWTDGYGSYRNTNDPTADPNHTEVGDWQLMPATR